MARDTKKLLRESFLRLLDERPLHQITIRDIVDECGVNRNTFYYYYRDLPQLMESIVNEAADQVIGQYPSLESADSCLKAACGFAVRHKRAVLHIYHSVNRDLYEHYQWRVCRHAAEVYLSTVLRGRVLRPEDRALLEDDLKCMLFGFAMEWLESGLEEEFLTRFGRICALKKGALETMIARCEEEEAHGN